MVISAILPRNMAMVLLTKAETREFARATTCANCGCGFLDENQKMRHHNHVDGHYLLAACCSCNLALKLCKCKL